MAYLFRKLSFLFVVLLCGLALCAQGQPSGQLFATSGEKILKNGIDFTIHGVNINGPGFDNRHKVTLDVDLIANTWKFNAVRVNCKLAPFKADPKRDSTLDEIVREFTGRGLVVIITPRDHLDGFYEDPPKPDKSPSLADLVKWYKEVAANYKGNPNVWFEVQAGPGDREQRVLSDQWVFTHETIIQTIRTEASAQNIIVCSGYGHGADDGNLGALFAPDSSSAVLSFGPDLVKKYKNIVFAFCAMESWNAGGIPKLNDYVDRVHARNLPIFVSEYGVHSWSDASYSTEAVLAAGKTRKLGHCAWQWSPNDRSSLCATDNHEGGWDVDKTDGSRPTNLSWLGDKVWIDNHSEPFHGPMLDRTGWTASSFTGDKPKNGRLNMPDQVLADYVPQEEQWTSDIAQAPGQWFQVDMGAKRTFTRVLLDTRSTNADFPRGYELYVSNDGINWGNPIVSGKNEQSVLRLSFPTQNARYIKVVQTGKNYHFWHIGTFQVFAPFGSPTTAGSTPSLPHEVLLDTRGWQASASPSTWYELQVPLHPRQGEWDRATSNRKTQPGDYYQVDMQQLHKFNKIVLISGRFTLDYPRGYELYVSADGTDWGKPIAAGRGAPITTIVVPTTTARFIRVVQTRPSSNDWVIMEFHVYADGGPGSGANRLGSQ